MEYYILDLLLLFLLILLAIGSGGPYALSAAKALMKNTKLTAKEIAKESLNIAADVCIYTNHNIVIEEINL